MSATPPSALEGTHAPSPFEVLWDRYRSLILTVVGAVLLALVGNYVWQYLDQQATDERWSTFVASLDMEKTYTDPKHSADSLIECIGDVDMASLEQSYASAKAAEKPYFLLAIARKAMLSRNWDRAEQALSDLETGYPKHSLVVSSELPVQVREPEKPPEDAPPVQRQKPIWKPAKEGSVVSLMRDQIEKARAFELPARFAPPEVPADASKVRFTLGDYGSFTIALMPQAPKHKEAFLKLAAEGFWNGIAVDEIQRSIDGFDRPRTLHLGYASTKNEDDRTKWVTTEPSEHIVDFEKTGLSHFEGAVAADSQADGKSCADRFWICADDAPSNDGQRVVFGFVTEGLDVLRNVCEATMSAQEEERGTGRPTENIRVTAVEVLE